VIKIGRLWLVAIAVVPVGVLLAILFVQNQKAGWPFNRHSTADVLTSRAVTAEAQTETPSTSSYRVDVDVAAAQVELFGVQVEPAEIRSIYTPHEAVATVVADESRIVHVHTRVSGWLESLNVKTTGQSVRAGQSLGGIFSQELYSSQVEFLSALQRGRDTPSSAVIAAGRMRLQLLGMRDAEVARIVETGRAERLVSITAPISGIVLNRGVSEGSAVDPSTEIVTLADLSQVWVIAEIPEAIATSVNVGTAVELSFPASGRAAFQSKVQFIYPMLTGGSRTVRVRAVVQNQDGSLRPGLYGTARIEFSPRDALTVERDAVVDTGLARYVFVQKRGNSFEPREVVVGAQLRDRVEILQGLELGERVVTSGTFLIDSESRLRSSGNTAHASHGAMTGEDTLDRTSKPKPHGH
jgi:membrane fusion protein, copper/silver efflux system